MLLKSAEALSAVLLFCVVVSGCASNKTVDDPAAVRAQAVASKDYRQALKLAEDGRRADAIAALEQTVTAQPTNAAAHNRLGMLYREAGRFADARTAYASALRIDPDYALAHRNLGILLDIYLQQPAQALEHYRAYARLAGAGDAEAGLWVAELERRVGAQ